ncbi:hypothetical protein [Cellulomonas cellasea]|uniref:Uncharacterized protein n=1 Tax=Cellulomonas cellasea TaxID=43670 RepID=A0A7W4YA46_9CELL|nr:hypothetical protein [Cellulomonas cellasea]MBB2921382.1 hypothetical protein [Cellulomonas cellasea]
MATSLKTVAALALAAVLSFSAAASAQAGEMTIQTGGATGCCRMNMN